MMGARRHAAGFEDGGSGMSQGGQETLLEKLQKARKQIIL